MIRMATTGIAALLIVAAVSAQDPRDASVLLQAAQTKETVQNDLAGAIELYEQAVKAAGSDPILGPRTLLSLARAYEKAGRPEARPTYQRIVKDFGNSGAAAATATARLAALEQTAGTFKARDLNAALKDATRITWSPDGKYVAYSKVAGSVGDQMMVRDIVRGSERSLGLKTGERPLSALMWSPDGQRVAIVVFTEPKQVQLRVISIPGGDARVVASGEEILLLSTWSPDSRRLSYYVTGTLGGRRAQGFVASIIPQPSGPSSLGALAPGGERMVWSPDSSQIAMLPDPGTANATPVIRIVNVNTQAARTIQAAALTTPASRTTLDVWTPGNLIKFRQTVVNGGDDYVVDAAGGAPRKICEGRGGFGGDGCQGLSPDGTLIITRKNVSGGGRIVLRNISTGEERPLTNEAVFEQTAGGFSSDGRLFAFRSNRDGRYAIYVVPVREIPVANPLKIASLNGDNGTGVWTGSHLVLQLNESETNLFRVDVDAATARPSGGVTRLTQDTTLNDTPYISPDGQRIAYVSRGGQARGFCVMDANGQRERLVHEVPADRLSRMRLLGWRSSTELLIADTGNAPLPNPGGGGAPRTLMVLSLPGGEMKALGIPPLGTGGMWFVPGAAAIVYTSGPGKQRYRSLETGTERDIPMPEDWEDFLVSPNGQLIAYGFADWNVAAGKPMPGSLRLRNLDGTNDRSLADFADSKGGRVIPLAWSPNGQYVLYQDPNSMPRIIKLDTKESWPLAKAAPTGFEFDYPFAHWSTDGSFVVIEASSSIVRRERLENVTYDAVVKLTGKK